MPKNGVNRARLEFSLVNQVVLRIVEQSSASVLALYSTCQHSIHNKEFSHGHYAILLAYQSMPCLIMSYAMYAVRPDNLGMNNGSLCLQAYLSILLVHSKGGRPGGIRVVT